MITKKWVESKAEALRQRDRELDTEIMGIKDQVGYERTEKNIYACGFYLPISDYSKPAISVIEKIDAICAYLGIEIVKESKEEKIVAKKIKKAK